MGPAAIFWRRTPPSSKEVTPHSAGAISPHPIGSPPWPGTSTSRVTPNTSANIRRHYTKNRAGLLERTKKAMDSVKRTNPRKPSHHNQGDDHGLSRPLMPSALPSHFGPGLLVGPRAEAPW